MNEGNKKHIPTPWALRLGHKLFSVAPYRTTLVVASSLASQIGLLLAFLLPLKIVMLLGAKGVPNYMPSPFDTMKHDTLVIVLSVLALTFYVIHLLANRVSEHASKAGARKLLETSRKIVLFENQDTLATTAYRQYAEALSGLTFTVMGLGVLGWLYDDVAVTILLFAVTVALAATIAARTSNELHNKLVMSAPIYVNAATGVGFLAIFIFIVFDFLALSPPNFLVAIIAIILGRQLLTQAGIAVRNIAFMDRQKQKISALFFHDTQFDHQPQGTTLGVWQLLERSQHSAWLNQLLGRDADKLLTQPFQTEWVQTNVRNVIAMQVSSPDKTRTFIVKAFDRNKAAAALHEATLLLERLDGLPSPPLVRVDTCRGFHCHVFEITNLETCEAGNTPSLARTLAAALLHVSPSKDLKERYSRSRKMLWERLDRAFIERLRLIAHPDDHRRLDRLELALTSIQKSLKQLPSRFYTPIPPANGLTYFNEHNIPVLAHWSDWTLVPQGAGWPIENSNDLSDLSTQLHRDIGPKKSTTSYQHVNNCCLAACLHAMLTEFDRQRYRDALEILALGEDLIAAQTEDRE